MMKESKNKQAKNNFSKETIKALVEKKEFQTAIKLKADIKKYAKSKGLEVVIPL